MFQSSMRACLIFALCALILTPLVFADVGPGPDPPKVTINLLQNGAPYTGAANVTYICENQSETAGTVTPGDIGLSCVAGKCTNANWYYKFNPCFYSVGTFRIDANGQAVTTDWVNLSKAGTYDYSIDTSTGEITSSSSVSGCLSAAIMLLLIGFVLRR